MNTMFPLSSAIGGARSKPQNVLVDIFLPTGIVMPLNCSSDDTLIHIKAQVWRMGVNYPHFNKLQPISKYIFQSTNSDSNKEEFHDEMCRLCDLELFFPYLKLIEKSSTDCKQEAKLNSKISIVLGSPVDELDELDFPEVIEFRRQGVDLCKEITSRRDHSKENHALYAFCAQIGKRLQDIGSWNVEDGHMVKVWITSENAATVKVDVGADAEMLIRDIYYNPTKQWVTGELSHRSEYVLKICCQQEYLLGSYPLSEYKYVQDCARRGKVPQLEFAEKHLLYSRLPTEPFLTPSYYRRLARNSESPNNELVEERINLWSISGVFRVQILCATFIKAVENVCVTAGIFHGDQLLCKVEQTTSVSNESPRWNEYLNFNLNIMNLPRCARLCVSLCSVPRNKKKQDEVSAIAWGNVNLFDFRGKLITGKHRVDLVRTPMLEDTTSLFDPLQVPALKRAYSDVDTTSLEINFDRHMAPVYYPTLQEMMCTADCDPGEGDDQTGPSELDPEAEEDLKEMVTRDVLCEISEKEKLIIWDWRKYCCTHLPNSLPHLVGAVRWNSLEHTTEFYRLLQDWKPINLETAMMLLDSKCVDLHVREFAVRNLEKTLDDTEISDLLLQLVQSLQFEPYIQSALGSFLLRKALTNRVVGNSLLWQLRSEMNEKFASWIDIRFALILEAYCRGLCGHLQETSKQVEALKKLTLLSQLSKEKSNEYPNPMELLKEADFLNCLQNLKSPVSIGEELVFLNVDSCKILSSAKKPLLLQWKSDDALASRIGSGLTAIIFKTGDDLRQDMLTLQAIRAMDELWRQDGLDLNILTYNCVSTGKETGIIEVVQNALTVFKIQRKAGTLAAIQVNSKPLHEFIRETNRTDEEYRRAIENFTKSCAGYCVATFILGIGDRHPDNIMLTEAGNVFHIDFGHFLGNFKSKFGFTRERVPFVLTDDFITVIAKGSSEPRKSLEFQEFQKLCGRAYLILRKHANLLITLFTLMLSSGIPELSGADVEYLRTTLAVGKSEADALDYFQTMLCEAYGGGWTTKLDWFFHSLNHM